MAAEPTLASKTILITGGTSRLGREFVRQALQAGAKVYFTYFSAADQAQELAARGALGSQLDLGNMRSIETWVREFRAACPSLDILIHNAAMIRDHTLCNLSEADWDEVMTVNLKAPYYLTKLLLPYFLKRKTDPAVTAACKKIFMITSRAAVTGGFGNANYAASKAGLLGLVKSLAKELGSRKILVNALNPGFMKSRMTEALPEQVVNAHLEASPLKVHADPAEAAAFLTFLCSDQMVQVTGQVFHFESRQIT